MPSTYWQCAAVDICGHDVCLLCWQCPEPGSAVWGPTQRQGRQCQVHWLLQLSLQENGPCYSNSLFTCLMFLLTVICWGVYIHDSICSVFAHRMHILSSIENYRWAVCNFFSNANSVAPICLMNFKLSHIIAPSPLTDNDAMWLCPLLVLKIWGAKGFFEPDFLRNRGSCPKIFSQLGAPGKSLL